MIVAWDFYGSSVVIVFIFNTVAVDKEEGGKNLLSCQVHATFVFGFLVKVEKLFAISCTLWFLALFDPRLVILEEAKVNPPTV